jgi:hypothetical protein
VQWAGGREAGVATECSEWQYDVLDWIADIADEAISEVIDGITKACST